MEPIKVGAYSMCLDSIDSLGLRNGLFEPGEINLIKSRLKPGYAVFDVGANIGYHTLIMSGLVGPTGRVFAFEPDPTNFSILKKNVEINNLTNVELFNKAVSSETVSSRLYLCPTNHGDHRLYDSADGRDYVEVDSVCLNDFIGVSPDFVKIDIQGSEFSAISGMSCLLDKAEILTEFWPYGLQCCGYSAEKYYNLLKFLGFAIYNINMKPVELSELSKYTVQSQGFTNLFCGKKHV